jgi:hypothetical protein
MRISAIITGMIVILSVQNGKTQGVSSELYQYNYFYVNPAFQDSSEHVLSFMGNYFEVDDNRRYNGILSYQANISKLKSSIGFQGSSGNSRESFTRRNIRSYGITINHAFQIGKSSTLTIGTKVYNQGRSYRPYEFISGDPVIGPAFPSDSEWLLDLGLVFRVKSFFSGLSVIGLSSESKRYGAIGGYTLLLSNSLKSEHSIYTEVNSDDLTVLDINNKLIIRDKFLVGLTYRTQSQDGFIVSTGVDLFRSMRVMFLVYSNTDESKDFKAEMMAVVRI